ncbi:P-loop containing nucleoside triphosphate hydrolase protein [Lentithecium fluviatile CBS 122367]|uniref:RNA helicase n=1 Tax=Lentithecium fluviatile CBS 122367 TaxID=1168545 RepID=A0A6G1JBW2_9PLEO|nr:P-loop containing nucleoside triphosphate hydrolase protein [Lentithecium fluviatile CBS 122367]
MASKRPGPENVNELRLRSRQAYLSKREELKLAELRKQVADEAEEERRARDRGIRLSEAELKEFARNRETLRLATERLNIDDGRTGFWIGNPEDRAEDKLEVLNKRRKGEEYKSESQLWEDEVTARARAAQVQKPAREREEDYEFVFDTTQALKWDTELKSVDPQKQMLQAQLEAAEKRVKSIEEVRKSLPIYQYKEQILAAVAEHQIIIVVANTGSGKTTQLPQYLLEMFDRQAVKNASLSGKMVACTQPRRVAATSVAKRVAEEMGTKLGHKVGYSIRFEDKTSEQTRLKYMTDGMLLRELMGDPSLNSYSSVIIDEAHERSINTDILCAILKDHARANPDFRLIVSSATMNAQAFSKYFDDAPIFNVPGSTFPVHINYTVASEANYLAAAVTTLFQIHLSQPIPGDVLIFLTGEDEIEAAATNVEETIRKLGSRAPELIVCRLYSGLDSALQLKAFEPTPPGARKVILSTNIAETSVTLDGVRWVCDPGYEKQHHFDSRTGMDSLVITPISRASAAQRAGRAGRTAEGTCLRLYTKHAYYSELPESTPPEIQRANLSSVVLQLKSLGINNLIDFDFPDPPSPDVLARALEELYALGALNDGGSLTSIGRKLAEFPLNPLLAKCILEADRLGCVDEVLTIVAMLGESGALFLRPKDKRILADSARSRFSSKEGGDQLSLLNVYNSWAESDYDPMFCKENFLQYRSLVRARDVRDQLVKLCDRVEVAPSSAVSDHVAIRKSLTSGFFANAARLARDGQSYRTIKNSMTVWIHPSSTLNETRPRFVIYGELVLTTKEYMRNVMPIDPLWLNEVAPHFFKEGEIEKLGVGKKMPKGQGKVGVDGR